MNNQLKENVILVTGSSGFIGFHLSANLLSLGNTVIGIDSHSDYYDVELKRARLSILKQQPDFRFYELDLCDFSKSLQIIEQENPGYIFHLAAQAGVRYSIENANVDEPVSFYAATKRCNEIMAYSYNKLYNIGMTGFRFFKVYGPYGRPDMAYFSFTKAILSDKAIDIYNNGELKRDFTYVDDIVDGLVSVFDHQRKEDSSKTSLEIYNIGNHSPVSVMDFIYVLETAIGKEAQKNFKPMQKGDVYETYADIQKIKNPVGFVPKTNLKEGLTNFVHWYRSYYRA